MKKILISLVSFLLLCSITLNLGGCLMVQAVDLMEGITPNTVEVKDISDFANIEITDFAVRLLQATEQGDNLFISPMSVMCALTMTANGAAGETLAQMEEVLGMEIDELNEYLYSYISRLPEGEKYRLSIANSIWFTDDDRLTVNDSFLQKNADYYGAEIYKTPFNIQTKNDINSWVRKETDGMIPKILDDIPTDAIMYLINTLAFDAEWTEIYEKYQVRDGVFTTENGESQDVKLMYSDEGKYISDELARGFIKYYNGRKYAFVALLPNEGVGVSEYIDSLNGEKLNALITDAQSVTVKTATPKFDTEYEVEMSDILSKMGMPDAFNVTFADFSNLGKYEEQNIFIGRVLHKTYIEVAERGTKAGAVTVVEMKEGTAAPPEEPKVVYLDRPFVYMIIDTENSIPLFVGATTDINN